MKVRIGERKWIRAVLFMIFCMGFVLPAQAAEVRVVRVGCNCDCSAEYHHLDKKGTHTGYEYEYLTEIAKHTGWRYEFIDGTWEESLERLKNGEIDLLGGMEKSRQVQDWMSLSYIPSSYIVNCLLADKNSDTYAYEDFEAFDGMRVGVLTEDTTKDAVKKYAEKKGFSCSISEYRTEDDLNQALKNTEVDCIGLSDQRDLRDYQVIGRFGYIPQYFIVRKSDKELLTQLDDALREIHKENRDYEDDLRSKYFTKSIKNAFTKEEKEFIEKNGEVPVYLFDGYPLICEYDEKTGQYQGIIMDILDELSEKTGLTFSYQKMVDNVLPWVYMEQHPEGLLAPFLHNSLIGYSDTMKKLDTIVAGRMVMVGRSGEKVDLDDKFILAIPEGMYGAEEKLRQMFPWAKLVLSDSHQNGLDMVCQNKADLALINETICTYLLQSPYYDELKMVRNDQITEDLTIGYSSAASPVLVSILNKGIEMLDERTVRQIVVNNTIPQSYQITVREWLYENRFLCILVVLGIAGTVFGIKERRFRKRRAEAEHQRMLRAEERHQADLEYQRKMYYQANYDDLTGLYNKGCFTERANEVLRRNPHKIYAFFHVDVEKFKMINEMYGQDRGDLVLIGIADMLRKNVGGQGVYGRLYADHFAVCYPVDENTLHQSHRNTLHYIECAGQKIRVQLNVGVCVNYRHYQDAIQMMDYALIALQNKEKTDDSNFFYYKEKYLIQMFRNQKITNEMETALREEQFAVYLQPQFDHITNKLVGAEALMRWHHPTEGMIAPGEFIPVFEQNQFIHRLDYYVCENVCRLLAKWKKQNKTVPVSINVSRVDLLNPHMLTDIQQLLEQYDVAPEELHLEITESACVENQKDILNAIEKIRTAGFTIEMDDFGSGYSSLNMLKDIPVDILKLDMRFLSGDNHMDRGGRIVEAMVNLAHSLGLLVIAEGVETEQEAEFLKSVHCHVVQGYLYGKPVSIKEFEKILAESEIGPKTMLVE